MTLMCVLSTSTCTMQGRKYPEIRSKKGKGKHLKRERERKRKRKRETKYRDTAYLKIEKGRYR